MIQQLQFVLHTTDGAKIPQAWAYRLYSWLLEQLPADWADALHGDESRPVTQFLHYAKERQAVIWTLNLRGEPLVEQAVPVLQQVRTIELQESVLEAELLPLSRPVTARTLLAAGRSAAGGRARLELLSPCAFKQGGRYAIFPQESLLLQSLAAHWNDAFPDFPVSDADALAALLRGVHIVDYNLHTVRYGMKGTRVPGALGSLTLEARLPLPLQELWNALLAFAPYSGIGIKTTLGMGGVQTCSLDAGDGNWQSRQQEMP